MTQDVATTLDGIILRAQQAVKLKQPQSILIEVPPGCERVPDVIARIEQAFAGDRDVARPIATLGADTVIDDGQLVDLLAYEWTKGEHALEQEWRGENTLARLPHPYRFKRLLTLLIEKSGAPRIALIPRFDRVFRCMSSELLAAMRDLEAEGRLITVNTAPLTYVELYRRRALEEPTFTSDYGQMHIRFTCGALERDEAERTWQNDFGLPLETRLGRAYFETALHVTGALPVAFARAAGHARDRSGSLNPDLPQYRAELLRTIPELFERVLRYDGAESGSALAQAIARLYLKRATPPERQLILSHRWANLMVDVAGGVVILKSEALGRKALELSHGAGKSPVEVYREGDYKACRSVLQQTGRPADDVLVLACEMMNEATEGGANQCYFGPGVKWRLVEDLAAKAAKQLDEDSGRGEFEKWGEIARANYRDASDVYSIGIRIGLRLVAVSRDLNAVTSVYCGLPLAEEILRQYVVLILGLPATGAAFADVQDEGIKEWWREPKRFERPVGVEKLSGTHLAVLAAVMSAGRGKPLFEDNTEFSRFLRLLDKRNEPAHYVITPTEQVRRELIERATLLLNAVLEQGETALQVETVANWMNPPSRFLMRYEW